ncbi:MAG: hypothetical protein RIS47_1936 [Bacteroidota bacterium]|jgi:dihydrofolate reductase
MKKLKLFIASSLDGYIARPNNSLDWLDEMENPNQIDHGYLSFLKEIDTLIMGRTTYEVVLGFGIDWPYLDQESFIASKQDTYEIKTPKTSVVKGELVSFVKNLKKGRGKNIWLVGGGELISELINARLVDEMIISVVPRIIGGGIRLFAGNPRDTLWELKSAVTYPTGVVNLTYKLKPVKESDSVK